MIKGSDIKDLRLENEFTQAMLARAICTDPVSISHYENSKRSVTLDTMESIANVFGKTVALAPLDESEANFNLDLYKDKTVEEIMELDEEDMINYLLVKSNDEFLKILCNLKSDVFDILEVHQIKGLLSETIKRCLKTDKAPLYQCLSVKRPILYDFSLIDYVCSFNEVLEESKKNMKKEVLEKIENDLVYIRVTPDSNFNDLFTTLDIEFLDKDKNKIDLTLEDIEVGEYSFDVPEDVVFESVRTYGYDPETELDEFFNSEDKDAAWGERIERHGDTFKIVGTLPLDGKRTCKDDLELRYYLGLNHNILMVKY